MAGTKSIKTRIQNKHGSPSDWAQATNFTPLAGEIIIYDEYTDTITGEVTPTRMKIGDGKTLVNDLGFIDESIVSLVQESQIQCGTADPSAATTGKFYFKYSNL